MSASAARKIILSPLIFTTTKISHKYSARNSILHFSTLSVVKKMQGITSSAESSKKPIQTFVVCGPSGSGKTTLLNMVTSFYKNCFKFCVSHTTRAPRKTEENGKAYHFVTPEVFQKMISENEFVEYAQFSGNYYGTSYRELEVVKCSNRIPILDVDIRGVMNLKKIDFFAKYIFITTPSFEILEKFLRMRGTESEETIQRRLKHAIEDVKTAEKIKFDLVIENSDLNEAAAVFIDFVKEDVQKLQANDTKV